MVTQQRLHELFEYRDDGNLIRKIRIGRRVKVGDIAGHLQKSRGYFVVGIDKNEYGLHRMIFLYHHGYLTDGLQVDHIDGDKINNRIENLRESTTAQNSYNSKLRVDNKSGVKGISWFKGKWVVHVRIPGKHLYLGRFVTLEEAKAVIEKARNEHHGDFARHN